MNTSEVLNKFFVSDPEIMQLLKSACSLAIDARDGILSLLSCNQDGEWEWSDEMEQFMADYKAMYMLGRRIARRLAPEESETDEVLYAMLDLVRVKECDYTIK